MAPLHLNRRKFLYLAGSAGVAALGADSVLIEPNRPQIVRRDISLRRWPDRLNGFTIAILSDFHYDPYFSTHPIHFAVGMVNDLRPDLIALTGDFVTEPDFGDPARGAANADPCAEILKNLRARHGFWAVLGNHDVLTDADRVSSALRAHGIPVLSNQAVPIERDGGRFWLAGLDDAIGKTADLSWTLQKVPKDEPTVLLVHEPDYADHVTRFPVDLQLSGHSHGGQIRIPFLPPLYLPELARKYPWGLYKLGNLTLYTNRGLGTVTVPVRFNCPPEVTLLNLRRG